MRNIFFRFCRFKLLKSECLALLGRCDEAQEIAFDIIGKDNSNADAIFVRGMCLYYQVCFFSYLSNYTSVINLI